MCHLVSQAIFIAQLHCGLAISNDKTNKQKVIVASRRTPSSFSHNYDYYAVRIISIKKGSKVIAVIVGLILVIRFDDFLSNGC